MDADGPCLALLLPLRLGERGAGGSMDEVLATGCALRRGELG